MVIKIKSEQKFSSEKYFAAYSATNLPVVPGVFYLPRKLRSYAQKFHILVKTELDSWLLVATCKIELARELR